MRIGTIDDLYTFLDTLARLERTALQSGSAKVLTPQDTVTFQPGAKHTVLANLEGQNVGNA
jgi:hypothetical protein